MFIWNLVRYYYDRAWMIDVPIQKISLQVCCIKLLNMWVPISTCNVALKLKFLTVNVHPLLTWQTETPIIYKRRKICHLQITPNFKADRSPQLPSAFRPQLKAEDRKTIGLKCTHFQMDATQARMLQLDNRFWRTGSAADPIFSPKNLLGLVNLLLLLKFNSSPSWESCKSLKTEIEKHANDGMVAAHPPPPLLTSNWLLCARGVAIIFVDQSQLNENQTKTKHWGWVLERAAMRGASREAARSGFADLEAWFAARNAGWDGASAETAVRIVR